MPKKKPKLDLHTLDYPKALNRLCGGKCPSPGVFPANWKSWSSPSRRIPVDDQISDLIAKSKSDKKQIKLRNRSELVADFGAAYCPYLGVRHLTAWAADLASRVLRDRNSATAQAFLLAELRSEATDLAASYNAFVEKWKKGKYLRLQSFRGETQDADSDTRRLNQVFNYMMGVREGQQPIVNSLNEIAKFAAQTRDEFAPKGSPADAWEREFIEQLGYGWYKLTGSAPSRGPHFSSFVTNCYASVGGDENANFERSIRTVLANVSSRPEHDRFDRDDHIPANKTVKYFDGRRAFEAEPTEEQLTAEVHGYIRSALEHDDFDSMAALRVILRGNSKYSDLIKPFLPSLRELRGWTEPSSE